MAVSNKLVNKKFIKDYTRERLWQLTKDDFKYLLNKHNIEFKKSASKEELIQLLLDSKIDMWEVYKYGKSCCFGMYAYELEEMLNIDSRFRAKLQKKGILKVAYQNKSSYGGNSVVNYYDLECLYKISKTEWEEYKAKYAIKPLTQKQLDALKKREETLKKKEEEERKREQEEYDKLIKDTTCDICGVPQMDYYKLSYIDDKNICKHCIEENEQIKEANNAIEDFFKPLMEHKNEYLIIDIETTDLYFNDICSVSIVDFNTGEVLFDELVRPVGDITMGASNVHKIYKEDTEQKGVSGTQLADTLKQLSLNKKFVYFNIGACTLIEYFKKLDIDTTFVDVKRFINVENPIRLAYRDLTEYSRSISNYAYIENNEILNLDTKIANHSLVDCFKIKKCIEKCANQKPMDLLF